MNDRGLLEIEPRSGPAPDQWRLSGQGFAVEHFESKGAYGYDFRWAGEDHYLALHDLVMSDTEMFVDGEKPVRRLDLRNKLTYLPDGCSATGWAQPARRRNAFVTLVFNPGALTPDIDAHFSAQAHHPMIYFESPPLRLVLERLSALARDRDRPSQMLVDSLGLVAAAELASLQGAQPPMAPSGLSARQIASVFDFVDAHLADDLTLADMAAAARLSAYHFVRTFKQTTGTSPYRFLLNRRVEVAMAQLKGSDREIGEIARAVGFNSSAQFSRTFRKVVGATPREYRRRA